MLTSSGICKNTQRQKNCHKISRVNCRLMNNEDNSSSLLPHITQSLWCAYPDRVGDIYGGLSASVQPRNYRRPRHRRGHHPPQAMWSYTEGLSRMCLKTWQSFCSRLVSKIFRKTASVRTRLTGIVPAASGSAAPPPRAVKFDGVPVAESVLLQSISSQITYFESGKLSQEFTEGHPGRKEKDGIQTCKKWVDILEFSSVRWFNTENLKRRL